MHGAQINFGDLTPYLTYDRNNSVTLNVNFLFLVVPGRQDVLFSTFDAEPSEPEFVNV